MRLTRPHVALAAATTAAGRARSLAVNEAAAAAGLALVAELAERGALDGPLAGLEPFPPGGGTAWVKGSPLRGKAPARHGARRWLLRRALPREAELHNLRWLARHLFRVPDPLAAVSLWRGGLPRHQLLVLAPLEGQPLDELLPHADRDLRRTLLDELAREAARMHALGFAHRDLYLRNVLVAAANERGDPRRLRFLDAWSGGPPRGAPRPDRVAARDLACALLEGANLLTPDEQRNWFETYLTERDAQAAPARRDRLLAHARVERARMLARIARDPGRWRLAAPPADWAL